MVETSKDIFNGLAIGRCGEADAIKINSDSINEMQFKP